MHRFQEESFFYHTLFDFKDIVDQFGDRVWEELELHCPSLYESFCAYKANKDVDEFLDSQYQQNYNDMSVSEITDYSVDVSKETQRDDCDYWKDEGEYND